MRKNSQKKWWALRRGKIRKLGCTVSFSSVQKPFGQKNVGEIYSRVKWSKWAATATVTLLAKYCCSIEAQILNWITRRTFILPPPTPRPPSSTVSSSGQGASKSSSHTRHLVWYFTTAGTSERAAKVESSEEGGGGENGDEQKKLCISQKQKKKNTKTSHPLLFRPPASLKNIYWKLPSSEELKWMAKLTFSLPVYAFPFHLFPSLSGSL